MFMSKKSDLKNAAVYAGKSMVVISGLSAGLCAPVLMVSCSAYVNACLVCAIMLGLNGCVNNHGFEMYQNIFDSIFNTRKKTK
jgi:hypothetical protein